MATTSEKEHMGAETEGAFRHLDCSEMHAPEHFVQFYETDDFLLRSLNEFIGPGLDMGDACIVIATTEHRERLEERLKASGRDLAAAHMCSQYITLDAVETLSYLMVDGLPEPERFTEVIGSAIMQAAKDQRHVRIFGELVSVLWAEGNQAAVLCLEALWNDLYHKKTPPFSLFCAYSMHDFAGKAYGVPFAEICKQHSQVIPDESHTLLSTPDERLRDITLLQQKATSLEAEIAERKAAEERLRVSENRYRYLFEASTDGIVVVDPLTCKIIDANPSASDLLGYTHEQLLGQELWHIRLFGDQQAIQETLQKVQEHAVFRYEMLPFQRSDGQRRYVDCVGTLYKPNGHKVIQWTIRDVTERQHAEKARLHLAAIVESSDDAILSKDLDGTVTSWNAAAERMYGYSAEEIVGQPVTLLFPPDSQDEFRGIMEHIYQGERVNHYETKRVRRDGSFLMVSVTVSPIRDSRGIIIGASAIARDITARKELEQQRDAFVSLVTHELKTPLTALQGNVQLAQRWLSRLLSQQNQLGAQQQRTLEEVLIMLGRSQQQLHMQNRLINDLLDVSRIQSDKLELRLAPCDLVALVYETVQEYQAAHPSRLITLELPEHDLLMVRADRDRLQQVLGNYLSNALKFSPASEPVLVGLALDAEEVRVRVADHGPGLSREQQRHIWQRFYQSHRTPIHNGARPGLGLGLYICQQLMSRQQGQVGIESTEGNGATFWFTLPLLSSTSTTP